MHLCAPIVSWKDERHLLPDQLSDAICVARVAHEHWEPGCWSRDNQQRLLIAACRSGDISVSDRKHQFSLHGGDILILTPGLPVEMTTHTTCGLTVIVADGPRCIEQAQATFGQKHRPLTAGRNSRPDRLIELILDIAFVGGAHRERRCNHLLAALLDEAADHMRNSQSSRDGVLGTWIRCKDFIDVNHTTVTSVTAWATACGVTRSHLSRLARRFSTTTATDYLQHLRLAHAATQLASGDRSIAQVAEAGGWSDAFVFSKAFRRRYGAPPSRWRGS